MISNSYIVYYNKIFYLYEKESYWEGILEFEELNVQLKNKENRIISEKFLFGPFPVFGNNEFVSIFTEHVEGTIKIRFYLKPDSYDVSLISDF